MPIYEYVCKPCSNKFEKMRPFSQAHEPADCPHCHKKAERVLSTCYSMSSSPQGVTKSVAGSGGGCASCGGGSCATCGA